MARRSKGTPLDGVLLLNKSLKVSSNHALQQVKRLFGAQKAGHTGSLDPLASGMLIICFGQANKYAKYLIEQDKTYQVTAKLGQKTTTADAEGEVIAQNPVPALSEQDIDTLFEKFTGNLEQVPTMFSALKHNGQPLYKLARQGIEVERKARKITIHQITLDSYIGDELSFTVRCSKGTYIRNLVEDMGDELGCGAYVSKLHRTEVGQCVANDMRLMSELAACENLSEQLLPVDYPLQDWPKLNLSPADEQALNFGQKIQWSDSDNILYRLYNSQDIFVGVGEVKDGILRPRRMMC